MELTENIEQAPPAGNFTCFIGRRRFAAGPLGAVALAVAEALRTRNDIAPLVFDDETGEVIDLDLRGSDREIMARLQGGAGGTATPLANDPAESVAEGRARGRPKLGVVAREVTLLPRHWEWLASQPGGASVALRKLVEEARRLQARQDQGRRLRDRTYRFMSAMAGDFAGFEEASRALFADDLPRFRHETGEWPADIRDHCLQLCAQDAPVSGAK